MLQQGTSERLPLRAGKGVLPVHGFLVPHTHVAVPVISGANAVPMPLAVTMRALEQFRSLKCWCRAHEACCQATCWCNFPSPLAMDLGHIDIVLK